MNPLTALKLYGLETERAVAIAQQTHLIVASRYMKRQLIQAGLDERFVSVIPYFVAPAVETSASRRHRRPDEALQIVFLGRLTDVKGCLVLIQAIRVARKTLDRQICLTVAGQGPLADEIESSAKNVGVPISMLGWIGSEQRAALMETADLLALPSLWPEPFGLVGLEAAAAGVPAVAFDVGGVRDWLLPGETGELAPGSPPSAAGLAEAIHRAAESTARLQILGARARLHAAQFSEATHVKGLETTFEMAIHRFRTTGKA